jgi:hypothetical protein
MEVEDSLAIGEGTAWIWNLVSEHFFARHQLVDWFYASAHLAEAARGLFDEGTPAPSKAALDPTQGAQVVFGP